MSKVKTAGFLAIVIASIASIILSAAHATGSPPKPSDPDVTSQSNSAAIAGAEAVGVGIGRGGDADANANANAVAIGGKGGEGGKAHAVGTGGAGGAADASATQSQSAQGGSATNAGNAQSLSVSSNYRQRLQAPSVSAPAVYASTVCAYGWSAGLAVPGAGLSGGKSKIDIDCNRREAARVLTALNPQLALKLMCADPLVAAVADIDMGDCIYIEQITIHSNLISPPDQPPADMSKFATKEELDRAFKKSQSK